jgi:hypothetical protein
VGWKMIYAVIVVFCFWCVAAVIDSGGQIYSYLTSPSAVRFHKKCINNVESGGEKNSKRIIDAGMKNISNNRRIIQF